MPEIDWPEFTVPEGSEIPTEPKAPVEAGIAPAPAPSGTAPAAQPPTDGTTPPAAAGAPPEPMLPKHRYDELNTRNQHLQTQLDKLTTLLHAIVPFAKAPAAPQAPAAAPDPVREKVLGQLREYLPWLDNAESLATMKDRIEAALQRLDEMQQEQEQAMKSDQAKWDGYAKQTLASVHAAVAPFLVAPGKTVADLSEFKRQTITDLFVRWIAGDESRAQRYDAHDGTLRDEFVKFFQAELVDPFKRESAAVVAARARKVANLPVGGQTSSTLGTAPPKQEPKEGEDPFDAALKKGWEMTQALLKSG